MSWVSVVFINVVCLLRALVLRVVDGKMDELVASRLLVIVSLFSCSKLTSLTLVNE